MTVQLGPEREQPHPREAGESSGTGRWRALAWPGAVCALTGLHVVVATLINREFLIRGDTDAQFAPTWYHLGELVRDGQWPPMLDPDSWHGGNYAAEALFGIYNPLNVLIWVFMSAVPNLLLGIIVVKGVALMALALGTYLLCRDYGAERWAAAVVVDRAAGVGLHALLGRRVVGVRPAGVRVRALGLVELPAGACSGAAQPVLGVPGRQPRGHPGQPLRHPRRGRHRPGAPRRGGGGPQLARRPHRSCCSALCVAALLPLVYLPLLETAELAIRSGGDLFSNNGKMRPALGDLFMLGLADVRTADPGHHRSDAGAGRLLRLVPGAAAAVVPVRRPA